VLLNWNGEKPIPAGLAQKLVPEKFQALCVDTPSGSPLNLTIFQEFCRKLSFEARRRNDVVEVFIGAPTRRHLEEAVNAIAQQIPQQRQSLICPVQVVDLSYFNSLALAVRLVPDYARSNREKLILQSELEQVAFEALSMPVRSTLSAQEWERIFDEVGVTGEDSPFRTTDTVRHVARNLDADLLLLLNVQTLLPIERCEVTRCQRLTPEMGEFPEPEPKLTILDLLNKELREKLQRDHKAWEQRKEAWDMKRAAMPVAWRLTIERRTTCEAAGLLQVLDLIDTREPLKWSYRFRAEAPGHLVPFREITVQTVGDASQPTPPPLPPVKHEWTEQVWEVAGASLRLGLAGCLDQLQKVALWKTDLKPWNLPQERQEPASPPLQPSEVSTQDVTATLTRGGTITGKLVGPLKLDRDGHEVTISASDVRAIIRQEGGEGIFFVDKTDGERLRGSLSSLTILVGGRSMEFRPDEIKSVQIASAEVPEERPEPETGDRQEPAPTERVVPLPPPARIMAEGGRLWAPLRAAIVYLGVNPSTIRARIVFGRTECSFTYKDRTVVVRSGSKSVTVGQETVELPVAPKGTDTLYVPAEFFHEVLGLPTEFDASRKEIRIQKDDVVFVFRDL
ncbi:MAG: copper amine oxidase N-terminal domain-containing protein, partial [Armatimonadetes bacterium]|nr:copper amine oxidase N-terminal domain-containing protein [Armatimonadota bacterium]